MADFTSQDHDNLAALREWTDLVDERLRLIESNQLRTMRRQRRMAELVIHGVTEGVTAAISNTLLKKAVIFISIGILIGSAIGTSAGSLILHLLAQVVR